MSRWTEAFEAAPSGFVMIWIPHFMKPSSFVSAGDGAMSRRNRVSMTTQTPGAAAPRNTTED
jgi:hypothetical protein